MKRLTPSRREFLRTTSVATGGLAIAARHRAAAEASQRPADVRISSVPYRPVTDYPIQPKRGSDVRLEDRFWEPKVRLNAEVTIPLEVRKLSDGGREFGNNVLEAAILSLQRHPNRELQMQVDARIEALKQAPARGNSGFEVATTHFLVTDKRDLLDRAIASADALYDEFRTKNPPFSGGERDAINCVHRKMYITGGVGTTGNEGFGEPYSLPNISAYAETCAVLMFITLTHRLFLATGDGKYIDVMERGMYNNALSGVSASGDRFFSVNRLASAGDGRDHRWERASLECCPPNLVRFLASMPGFVYAQGPDEAIYVNLYLSSETSFTVGGRTIALSMESGMPWDGSSKLTVAADADVNATIRLRIPGWTRNQVLPGHLYSYANKADRPVTMTVNGSRVSAAVDRMGYVSLNRPWKNGDVVELDFPIETRWVVADKRVKENRGRMAIERGPIVYCVEAPDAASGEALGLLFDPARQSRPEVDGSFFGGVTVLHTEARSITTPASPARPVRLIPYYLWANRGVAEMSVWLSTREYAIGDTGPAGGLIFYVNPNVATDGWRYLEAAPFDQSAGVKWGCFRRAIPGARGTAIGTGNQNTADMLAACAEPGTAAHLCATLILNGVGGWFLPSRDELAAMYRNLKAAGLGDFRDAGLADNVLYWTSSQQTADMANHIDFADLGRLHYDDKDFPRRVRAIRAL